MPYTDDPANVPSDQVRLLVGDTNVGAPELSDNEVAFFLIEESDDPRRAAARAAEVLAAKYANVADTKQVGPLRLQYTEKANRFSTLARRLWGRSAIGASGPYAGGISISDKNDRVRDGDRVRPAFTRRGMRYPNTDAHGTTEELLSPPEVLP